MSKYSDFIAKQEAFVKEIEKSRNGINHELYRELVNLNRASVSSKNISAEKYEEAGKEYNLYSEEGFAYKYTLVFLCDFLLSNGFQVPEEVLEKYNLFVSEITFYKTILESKGNFDFSTIKYILSIDLGLREQMKEIFGEEIITEEFFPKFDTVKSNLETIKVIFKETKRRLIIKNFSPDELKMAYTTAMEQRLHELESQLVIMKEKIEKEGFFTVDNHPQYKKFQSEYNQLQQKIFEIRAMTEPQEIEQLRADLISKIVDYQSQYRELDEGKKTKGIKDKETLEIEKNSIVASIADFSKGGIEKKKLDDDMQNIEQAKVTLQKLSALYGSVELRELKDLIEKYEKQSKTVKDRNDEIERLKQQKETAKNDYDDEIKRFTQLGKLKQLAQTVQSNQLTYDLNKEIKRLDNEIKQKEQGLKAYEELLNSIGVHLNKKVVETKNKYAEFTQFFPEDTPETTQEWKFSVSKFEERKTELKDAKDDFNTKILDKEQKIRNFLRIPSTEYVTRHSISIYLDKRIKEDNIDLQEVEKALKFATVEEQQPGYFDNLEIGVSLAEEEIAARKR